MKTPTLYKYPFYNSLDAKSLNFLEKNLKPISVPKDNILFFQGDICENIFFLQVEKLDSTSNLKMVKR